MIETFTEKDKVLVGYLLNELSETEIVELEDEMLLNEDLFERLQVVEMNLIDGYIRNEMTHEERLRFKENFLVVAENRDKVNHAQIFHDSLSLLHEKARVAPLAAQEQDWRQWVAGLFQRPLPVLALTTIAVLLIAVLIVVFNIQRPSENANTVVANSAPTVSDNANQVANIASNNSVVGVAPTPQRQPVAVPSANKRPTGSGTELAKNDPHKYTQSEYLNRQDESGVERSGSNIVHITLGKTVTNLSLIYELLDDAPKRETYSVKIKNQYNEIIWPQNNQGKEDVRPVYKKVKKRRKFIIINVPTSIFKDSGPYSFEFDEPNIRSKNFTIKK